MMRKKILLGVGGIAVISALLGWWYATSKTSGLGYALINIWANMRAGDPLFDYPPPPPPLSQILKVRYFIEGGPSDGDYVLFPIEVNGYTYLPGADCGHEIHLPPIIIRDEAGTVIYSHPVLGTCAHDSFVSYDEHIAPDSRVNLPDSGTISIASTSMQVHFKPDPDMEEFGLCGTPLLAKRIMVHGVDAFNAIMQIKNTSGNETIADKRSFCQSIVYHANENHRIVLTDVTTSDKWMYVDITGDGRYAIDLVTNAIYPISGFDGGRSRVPVGYLK